MYRTERNERVSQLKIIRKRKGLKLDILDTVMFLRNIQVHISIRQFHTEMRSSEQAQNRNRNASVVRISLLLKTQMECYCDCLQRIHTVCEEDGQGQTVSQKHQQSRRQKSFTGALWLLSFDSFKCFSFLKTIQNIKNKGGIIPTSQFIHCLFSETTRQNHVNAKLYVGVAQNTQNNRGGTGTTIVWQM